MKILAIETSCDDTAIAVLEVKDKKYKVLSNIVCSQIEIHKQYGGVFPMMAKREHQRNLLPVLNKSLSESKLLNSKSQISNSKQIPNSKLKIIKKILQKESELSKQLIPFLEKYEKPDVDLIAVTNGPGLEPCLWVGVNFAKALSYLWDIPIVAVNHVEAHILVNFLSKINKIPKSKIQIPNFKNIFPAVALIVSGGHTQLILMKKIGDYEIIGETRDDAAGECFDKCAKILGLEYPGGPIISKIASEVKKSSITLPRPMINTKDYDFSFSGLKTAVLYKVREKKESPSTRFARSGRDFVSQMCFEVQQAIIDVLIKKTIQAAKDFKSKTIILGGGVSANNKLRSQFEIKNQPFDSAQGKKSKIKIIYPEKNLSTDNGLMIAVTAFFHKNKKVRLDLTNLYKIKANANLRIGKL